MRKLRIKLDDLELAFGLSGHDGEAYLDRESGVVYLIGGDFDSAWAVLHPETLEEGAASGRDEVDIEDFEQVIESARERLESDDRYLLLPAQDSREGYRDMQGFIWSLDDQALAERLERAIEGKGAFRRFKDTLAGYPQAEAAWFKFKEAQERERIEGWLEDHDIEPEFV
jgi:hypothetical protein